MSGNRKDVLVITNYNLLYLLLTDPRLHPDPRHNAADAGLLMPTLRLH